MAKFGHAKHPWRNVGKPEHGDDQAPTDGGADTTGARSLKIVFQSAVAMALLGGGTLLDATLGHSIGRHDPAAAFLLWWVGQMTAICLLAGCWHQSGDVAGTSLWRIVRWIAVVAAICGTVLALNTALREGLLALSLTHLSSSASGWFEALLRPRRQVAESFASGAAATLSCVIVLCVAAWQISSSRPASIRSTALVTKLGEPR